MPRVDFVGATGGLAGLHPPLARLSPSLDGRLPSLRNSNFSFHATERDSSFPSPLSICPTTRSYGVEIDSLRAFATRVAGREGSKRANERERERQRSGDRERPREREGGGRERGRWGKAMLADTEIKATVVLFSPSFIARRVRCERLVRT
jgi:hypothetical protein